MHVDLRKDAGFRGGFDAEAAAGVMQIQKYAAMFLGNCRKRPSNQFVAVAGGGTKDISGQTVRMNPHQRGLRALECAANQSDVLIMVHLAAVGNHAKITEGSRQNRFGHPANVAFVLHAIADEFSYREHFQFVLAAKFDELRHAGHSAVFVHDFADYAGIVEASYAREIDASFGLPSTDKHAAVARAQWKHVAGTREILRLGLGIDGCEHGDGAV